MRAVILSALVLVLALPFVLRPAKVVEGPADAALVIITPHNEALRSEFGRAFQRHYLAKTGRRVAVDWRVIGGTSEITRYLESEYTASFRNHWAGQLGRRWNLDVQAAHAAAKFPADASPEAREARAAFLASNVGCGIDLFFGGGPYDFDKQAQAGRLVPSGVDVRHPEWFTDEILPVAHNGEPFRDPQGRWVGTVLSSYGILSNRLVLERLGVPVPHTWMDLADPRLVGEVALADPTKSSSIAKAFENLIQQQMKLALARSASSGRPLKEREAEAVREGWASGLQLLQRMGGNARYFSDSSQKPPIDVAQGNAAVGVCIDFYGRQQAESVARRGEGDRLEFNTPRGGSVSSVDPVGLLRGAPHRDVAEAFIDFVLSPEGQRIWNFKPGTMGGPDHYALRRLPVRKDYYTSEPREPRSDPLEEPFGGEDPLVYRPEWTGGLFREMAFILRVMCLDPHPELQRAWREIVAAGMPSDALDVLQDVSKVNHEQASGRIKRILGARDKVEEVRLANELANHFRHQYERAAELASAHRRENVP